MSAALECRVLIPELAPALSRLFERLLAAGVDSFFHPHAFTTEEAVRLSRYAGKDLYYGLSIGDEMVGYGMLRGWDEGFQIPSLGIVIDPAYQGCGYGRLLMEFLHASARARGAERIRLKVHPENMRAIALYESLGYVFRGNEQGQMVGILELPRHSSVTLES